MISAYRLGSAPLTRSSSCWHWRGLSRRNRDGDQRIVNTILLFDSRDSKQSEDSKEGAPDEGVYYLGYPTEQIGGLGETVRHGLAGIVSSNRALANALYLLFVAAGGQLAPVDTATRQSIELRRLARVHSVHSKRYRSEFREFSAGQLLRLRSFCWV